MKKAISIIICIILSVSFTCSVMCGVKDTYAYRSSALTKVFNLPYNKCYADIEILLKQIPQVSIYAKDKTAIALYYINPNTTPVGIFFTEIDASHTKVEISSASLDGRDAIAKVVFSGNIKDAPSAYKVPEINI